MRRNSRWVRGVLFGVLGESDRLDDVAQQVWQSVWKRIPDLREDAQWRTWLYRLARNAAIDAGREQSRLRRLSDALADQRPRAAVASPVGELVARETHGRVMEAIRSLPALYREPFVLRHVNGWSYREIGETMNLPPATVETRLVRARRLLREALADTV